MKVLVTGGCGFLGSHVCEYYIKKGWEVIAYDNLTKHEYSRIPYLNTEKVRDYNLNLLQDMGVLVVIEDIENKKALEKFARRADFIVHTAAQPAMTIAVEDPVLDFEVNVRGTLNLLEVARKYQIPMVNCSTIHIYGNGLNEALEESEEKFSGLDRISEADRILTGSLTPLHASKRASEIYVQTYADTYGVRAASFRLTGMYGPRQFGGEDHGWVANFAIRTILELPIKVFGTDKQVRDILYVQDAVRAFDAWYGAGCLSGIYNIGGGYFTATSIRQCLRMLEELIRKPQEITLEPARKGDLWWFVSDIRKAWDFFRWKPQTDPKGGLEELVKWIQKEIHLFQQ
jgi:CDP-paratose 2-epimerase